MVAAGRSMITRRFWFSLRTCARLPSSGQLDLRARRPATAHGRVPTLPRVGPASNCLKIRCPPPCRAPEAASHAAASRQPQRCRPLIDSRADLCHNGVRHRTIDMTTQSGQDRPWITKRFGADSHSSRCLAPLREGNLQRKQPLSGSRSLAARRGDRTGHGVLAARCRDTGLYRRSVAYWDPGRSCPARYGLPDRRSAPKWQLFPRRRGSR